MGNNSYYIYIDTQRLLKRLNELTGLTYNNKEILNSFDIVLQLVLLNLSFSDNMVDKYELEFIDKITLDDDILVRLSKKLNRSITWSSLEELSKSSRKEELIESLKIIFSKEIDFFITFLGKTDGLTTKDYSIELYNNIKLICNNLAKLDGDYSDEKYIDNIINDIFFSRYLDLKGLVK